MRKWFCALLVLAALALGGVALADALVGDEVEVVRCEEFITLREEPSTSAAALARMPLGSKAAVIRDDGGDFLFVSYGHQAGYALRRYLAPAEGFAGREVSPTRQERYNVNLFLSNFTEADFTWGTWHFDAADCLPRELVDFAIDHIWFNQQDKLEWGEWGEDNVRLSENYIPEVTRRYFGLTPRNLGDTRMDYRNGYYYWQETGGHTSSGFACLTDLRDLGGGVYSARFYVLGSGEDWDNDVCYDTLAANEARYAITRWGHALIDTGAGGNLSDHSAWKLTRYTLDPMW